MGRPIFCGGKGKAFFAALSPDLLFCLAFLSREERDAYHPQQDIKMPHFRKYNLVCVPVKTNFADRFTSLFLRLLFWDKSVRTRAL